MFKTIRDTGYKILGATAMVVSSILPNTGCQNSQIKYMNDPQGSPALEREAGRISNELDAFLPRTYSESANSLNDKAKRLPTDLAELVDSATGLLGVRIFRGEFFGAKAYPGIYDETDSDAWNFKPLDRFTGETADSRLKYAIMHVPNSLAEVLGSVGNLAGNSYGTVAQVVNMAGVLPLTANTSARADALGQSLPNDNPNNDREKLILDGLTDPLKQPIRYLLTVVDPSNWTPDSITLGFYNGKKWANIEINQANLERIQNKFKSNSANNKRDEARILVNLLPIGNETLDPLFWGTTYRIDPVSGKSEMVASTRDDSMNTNISCDNVWYGPSNNPTKAPGIIDNGQFFPAQSVTVGLGKDAAKAALFLLPWITRGSSSSNPIDEIVGGRNGGPGGNGGGIMGGRTGGAGGN
jgi:hypothetical protein